jgi:hypothetical protein
MGHFIECANAFCDELKEADRFVLDSINAVKYRYKVIDDSSIKNRG